MTKSQMSSGSAPNQEQKQQGRVVSPGAPGDDRTPDKTIGEVKYARAKGQDSQGKGGAGDLQVSDLEPEKQGGIGGP